MRRPGRFDYHIEVPQPDEAGRAAILRVCLAKLKTRRTLPLEALVQATAGYSGADLAALCREAGLHAIRRGLAAGMTAKQLVLTRQDMEQALLTLRTKRVPEPLAVLGANVLRASQEGHGDVDAHRSANQIGLFPRNPLDFEPYLR